MKPVTRARDAAAALHAVIEIERRALRAAQDFKAGEFRAAIARAQRVLASVAVDPLRSGTMSPTATVVPATRRSISEARSLVEVFCAT